MHSLLNGCQYRPADSFSVNWDYILCGEPDIETCSTHSVDSFHSAQSDNEDFNNEDFSNEEFNLNSSCVEEETPGPLDTSVTWSYLWGGFSRLKSYFSPKVKHSDSKLCGGGDRINKSCTGNLNSSYSLDDNVINKSESDANVNSQSEEMSNIKEIIPDPEETLSPIKLDFPLSPILQEESSQEKEDNNDASFFEYQNRAIDSSTSSHGSFSDSDVRSPVGGPCPNDSLLLLTVDSSNSSAEFDEDGSQSFNTNMNVLANQLEKFQIKSPQASEKCQDDFEIESEPCANLFVGKVYSELQEYLEKGGHYNKADGLKKRYTDSSSLPVVFLRQVAKDDVIADLYIPPIQGYRNRSLLDGDNLVIDEEGQRQELERTWVGHLTYFSTKESADRIADLEEAEVAIIQITGIAEDKDSYLLSK